MMVTDHRQHVSGKSHRTEGWWSVAIIVVLAICGGSGLAADINFSQVPFGADEMTAGGIGQVIQKILQGPIQIKNAIAIGPEGLFRKARDNLFGASRQVEDRLTVEGDSRPVS